MTYVTNRSRLSLLGTLAWALPFVVASAALRPGRLWQIELYSLAVVGAGVLWNIDAIAVVWREGRAAKSDR